MALHSAVHTGSNGSSNPALLSHIQHPAQSLQKWVSGSMNLNVTITSFKADLTFRQFVHDGGCYRYSVTGKNLQQTSPEVKIKTVVFRKTNANQKLMAMSEKEFIEGALL